MTLCEANIGRMFTVGWQPGACCGSPHHEHQRYLASNVSSAMFATDRGQGVSFNYPQKCIGHRSC